MSSALSHFNRNVLKKKKLPLWFLIYSLPDKFMNFFFHKWILLILIYPEAHTMHVAAELYVCSTHYNGKGKWNHSSQGNTFDLLFAFTQMSQNYYSSEDSAQIWFWTALVSCS